MYLGAQESFGLYISSGPGSQHKLQTFETINFKDKKFVLFTFDIMTEQSTTAKTDGSITTYCIEHAKTQQSKCAACEKTIPHKSLRVAEIYRKSKKVKKDLAKHTWYHFKCFKGKL